MSDLNDLVPALKRASALPGTFDELYPEANDSDLVGYLMDSIAEAQLDGFLSSYEVDPLEETVEPDLSNENALKAPGALVVLYAAYRMVLTELRNVRNRVSYTAGPTQFEEERTASMLNEILRQLHARKQDIIEEARKGAFATDVYVHDMAFIKATEDWKFSEPLRNLDYRGA